MATTIKYSDAARCPKCKGMLCYDASFTQKLPLGLGFAPNDSRFRVDSVLVKGWRGSCLDCGEQVNAVVSRRHVTSYPAAINRKIRVAQAA